MSEESWNISEKDWDEWVKANPNLPLLNKPALVFSTTEWDKFHIGWIEIIDILERKGRA